MHYAGMEKSLITVSLSMIVKNEELTIERCLNSVANIVDEIIIIDTGSTDRTKELCSKYTDKIYDFKWIDDFSAARNYSYSFATMDYILWLDADDILLPEDNIRFRELKKELNTNTNVVMMKYNTGMDMRGNTVFSYYRERLSKRNCSFQWMEQVHEYLHTFGKILNSDICITHAKPRANGHSSRNIEIYENSKKAGIPLSPRGMYYYARELKDHARFSEAIEQFEYFLDSNLGWLEDNISACSELAKSYLQIGHSTKALQCMFRSFAFDSPRAELCCQIGYYYQEKEDYKSAAFWFEFILTLRKPNKSWGFLQHDCWEYIPLIECAVCYDRLGNYKKADKFNNRALRLKPNSTQALINQTYLKTKILSK